MKPHVTICAVLFLLAGYLVIVTHCAGCFPADKTVEAAAGYEAQQLACVDRYSTRVEIDACRNKVKAAWAVDAGKDATND